MERRKVRVYIDAFNLYYGALKNTPYKWLSVLALARRLAGGEPDVVKYFTATVALNVLDPAAAGRQATYLQALATFRPRVEIHLGRYVQRRKGAILADPPHARVQILHTEEKGSDVNLATHLLVDGHRKLFDTAYVVSNDSDLVVPVMHVRDELGLKVFVVNPHPSKKRSYHLSNAATGWRQIRHEVVRVCQLPDQVMDGDTPIHKPSSW